MPQATVHLPTPSVKHDGVPSWFTVTRSQGPTTDAYQYRQNTRKHEHINSNCMRNNSLSISLQCTHTHTHIYIYIYIDFLHFHRSPEPSIMDGYGVCRILSVSCTLPFLDKLAVKKLPKNQRRQNRTLFLANRNPPDQTNLKNPRIRSMTSPRVNFGVLGPRAGVARYILWGLGEVQPSRQTSATSALNRKSQCR